MTMNGIFILVTIAVYFGILLLVAHITSVRSSDNDAFFRGNRQSPWYIVSFGMIGASLSGVTFVSVPGMVRSIDMTYMQTCLGFFVGYLLIAHVLLPLYYRLNLISIYTYLKERFGVCSYKTGASFFLVSKLLGASARLYLVCLILQHYVFDAYGVPFLLTAIGTVVLIWLYTHKSGIRTIVWTDSLQTFCLLAGIFITIVMTGLDQDMMQKNLSCRNLKEAQKNMYCYGFSFLPVNFLFLVLGILLLLASSRLGVDLPAKGDDILPMFAAEGYLGPVVLVLFTIGIIAAAFSSADSALAALTTSFCIDILEVGQFSEGKAQRIRRCVHIGISVVFIGCMLVFKAVGSQSIIDTIYVLAAYTYGPLLGMFAFGMFTRRLPRDRFVPYVALLSPLVCYATDRLCFYLAGYAFGYEMLMFNGLLTFLGLWSLSRKVLKS